MANRVELHIEGKENASQSIDKVLDNVGRMGPAIAGAAAVGVAALAGLTVAAFKLGESFDDAYDTITAKTGATGAALEGLKDDVRSVFGDIPTDLGKASTAIAELNARTGQTGEGLRDLAKNTLELTRLTGGDLSANIRGATRLFGDWGVETDQQSATLDKLLRASQATGASVEQLMGTTTQFGATLRLLGFSLDESLALVGKWEKEGVETEKVMGGMRIATGHLAAAGVDLKGGFQDVIDIIRDMEDPTKATALAMEVFGARAGPDMAAAIREGRFELGGLLGEIESGNVTIGSAALATEDARERMQKAWNTVEGAVQPAADAVFDFAGDLATELLPVVRDELVPKLKELSKEFQDNLPNSIETSKKAMGDLKNVTTNLLLPLGIAAATIQNIAEFVKNPPSFERLVDDMRGALGNKPKGPGTGPVVFGGGEGSLTGENIISGGGVIVSKSLAEQRVAEAEAATAAYLASLQSGAQEEASVEAAIDQRRDGRATERARTAEQRAATLAAMQAARGGDAGGGGAATRAGAGGGSTREIAERSIESAIDGFMAGIGSNEANLKAQFGDIGGGAATALWNAFEQDTKSSGQAAARSVEQLIMSMQKEGVEQWREMGDLLASSFHTALVDGTPEARAAALGMVQAAADAIIHSRELAEAEKAAEKLAKAFASIDERLADSTASARSSAARQIAEIEADIESRLGGTSQAQLDRQGRHTFQEGQRGALSSFEASLPGGAADRLARDRGREDDRITEQRRREDEARGAGSVDRSWMNQSGLSGAQQATLRNLERMGAADDIKKRRELEDRDRAARRALEDADAAEAKGRVESIEEFRRGQIAETWAFEDRMAVDSLQRRRTQLGTETEQRIGDMQSAAERDRNKLTGGSPVENNVTVNVGVNVGDARQLADWIAAEVSDSTMDAIASGVRT